MFIFVVGEKREEGKEESKGKTGRLFDNYTI